MKLYHLFLQVSESESGGEPRWYIGGFVPQLITTTNYPKVLSCLVNLFSPVRMSILYKKLCVTSLCISLQCCAHILVCSATTYSGVAEAL